MSWGRTEHITNITDKEYWVGMGNIDSYTAYPVPASMTLGKVCRLHYLQTKEY